MNPNSKIRRSGGSDRSSCDGVIDKTDLDQMTIDDNIASGDEEHANHHNNNQHYENGIYMPAASNLPPLNFSSESRNKKASMTSSLKNMIGPYVIGEMIGKGGFATVFKGLNSISGDFVAIKRFDKSKISKEQLTSVMVELDFLKKFEHDNIVSVLGKDENDTYIYLILEYMENGSLSSIMNQFGTFPESLVSNYIEHVLNGLIYLHSENIIHRDIKAANILINKVGDAKLADFNVAAQLGESDKRYSVVGTPYWMAPEVIDISGHCQVSDIWSVGCTIIELLTGSPPYYNHNPMAAMFRIVQDVKPPYPKNITTELNEFLDRCFVKSVEERASAKELINHRWIAKYKSNRASVNPRASNVMDHISKTISAFNSKSGDASGSSNNNSPMSSSPNVHHSYLENVNEHHFTSDDDEKSNTIAIRPSSTNSSLTQDSEELRKLTMENNLLKQRIKELEKESNKEKDRADEYERKYKEILLSSMHYMYIIDSSMNIGQNGSVNLQNISQEVSQLRNAMRDQIESEYYQAYPNYNLVPRFIERRMTRDTLINLPKKSIETQKKEKKKAEKKEKEKLEKEKKEKERLEKISHEKKKSGSTFNISPEFKPENTSTPNLLSLHRNTSSGGDKTAHKRIPSKNQLINQELSHVLSQQNFKLNNINSVHK
ncbi:putative protein serine/threonine kinase [Heterostelium album PN500]|uniref:non-specific serine/threonine protein kinase n=1 Tax=Heterostelium pallidum (strain ATCC 26659 / Pp 5 / PN500) TaxID=670386 RepID=D3AYR5_HETP5|nr:putative protein serine/threonine kinase [Heterostelium album PN500]EFA86092.1 putative protein serine/threonine kinase [Heterostelium album PN500]|eukprot:XP_020438198.1 putative protein serine/threonine kinase [Heterostelium album PN500]